MKIDQLKLALYRKLGYYNRDYFESKGFDYPESYRKAEEDYNLTVKLIKYIANERIHFTN